MKARAIKRPQLHSQALDRFVVVRENRLAHRAIRRLAACESIRPNRRKPFPLLYLHGAPGTGKSHLVRGLVERVIGESSDRSARSIPARDLGRLLSEGVAESANVATDFRACDLLIIEDVQHLPGHTAEALSRLIDYRHDRDRSSVVTGVSGPALLTHLPIRLTSRLTSGLVVGLEPLSRLSRLKLARSLVAQSGLYVTDDVIHWLARQPAIGARPIMGEIAQLEHLSRQLPPPLDMRAVKERIPANEGELTSEIDRVAERVAQHFGCRVNQLKGRKRHRHLLWPRHVGMYLARQLTDSSLARIGEYFGGYDHSTVLHACRRVEQSLQDDERWASEMQSLRLNLQ